MTKGELDVRSETISKHALTLQRTLKGARQTRKKRGQTNFLSLTDALMGDPV